MSNAKQKGTTGGAFKRILDITRKFFERFIAKLGYDLWEDINNCDIAKSSNPQDAARAWMRGYASNKDNLIGRKPMQPSQMYMFHYREPKYKDELDWYDENPLIISLGNTIVKGGHISPDGTVSKGGVREVGINIHHLPARIARLVVYRIFYLYKVHYLKNMHKDKPIAFDLDWQAIKTYCDDLGVGFAVRMYIPELRAKESTVMIAMEDWAKAVWYPSSGFAKKTPAEIERLWLEYVRTGKVAKEKVVRTAAQKKEIRDINKENREKRKEMDRIKADLAANQQKKKSVLGMNKERTEQEKKDAERRATLSSKERKQAINMIKAKKSIKPEVAANGKGITATKKKK